MKQTQIKKKDILIIEDNDKKIVFPKDYKPGLIICSKKKWLSSRKLKTIIPKILEHGGSLILLSEIKVESVENKINFWIDK